MLRMLQKPWEKLELILVTLEKGPEANRELIELIRKTNTVLEVLLRSLTGIFITPRSREDDGLVELLIKSVAGTVDLVALTIRGVENSPTTIYLKMNEIFKKRSVARPSLAFSLNARQSKSSREIMRGGFEITIDENELKRQVSEELNKTNQYCRGCVVENIPEKLSTEIQQIQKVQEDALEKQRAKSSSTNLKDLSNEVATLLFKPEEAKSNLNDTDPEGDVNLEFSGFPSALGEPDPGLNEELSGFDNIDEFDDTNLSPMNSDHEMYEDFVTVKEEEELDSKAAVELALPDINKNFMLQGSLEENKASDNLLAERSKKRNAVSRQHRGSEALIEKAKSIGYSKYKDDYRVPGDDKVGGMPLVDKKVMQLLRDVAKEYLKQFFGRIFSGNFNLTTISFPIKCMRPLSLLESFANGGALNLIYLTKATSLTDPVERVKYIISAQLSTFYSTSSFLKPVPIPVTVAKPDTGRDVQRRVRGRNEVLRRTNVPSPAHLALHVLRPQQLLCVHRLWRIRRTSRTELHYSQCDWEQEDSV
eukprot:TRINITY_DN801_c0_g2_i1.p1 TRINITY_DN801_c0_g2~~TRINITY_DN801_c0_g2_i1.p1  ORF type:complete len:535 (+),score=114.72 TRINITY_DN801_c0_g2_i1:685-2289(+)